MVSHWSLSDSKPPQVSRNLLSIPADLDNTVVWTVSTRPFISKFSSPCTNPFMIIPRAPITLDIIVTFMFHSFFNSLAKSRYSSLFSLLSTAVTARSTIPQVLLFVDYYKIWSSGRDWWYIFISKSQRSLCVPFSRTDSGLCIYHLFYGQISTSSTIPSWSPSPPSRT